LQFRDDLSREFRAAAARIDVFDAQQETPAAIPGGGVRQQR
jgi:hypothetical protein